MPILFLVLDLVILTVVYFLSSNIWVLAWSQEKFVFHIPTWLIPLTWALISFLLNIYNDRIIQAGPARNIRKITEGYALLVGVILLVIVFGKFKFSRSVLFFFLLLDWAVLLGSGYVRSKLLGILRSMGYSPRHITFVGNQEEIDELQDWISSHPEKGFQEVKIFKYNPGESMDLLLKQIRSVADSEILEELVLGSFHESSPDAERLIDLAEEYGLRVFLHSQFSRKQKKESKVTMWGPFLAIRVRQEPLNGTRARIVKRGVDLAITIPVLIFGFWWFYLLMLILIKSTSKGPAIFLQKRIGKDGEPFNCYKFRTMRLNQSSANGRGPITQCKDKRITWIGRFLRVTNLDELPQLINVLKGEMSLAGPRPHMVEEDETVSQLLNKYRIRRFVKPGITGWAAVNGYRGGTDDMELMQRRVDYDIYYIENWTPWLDTKIFFMTLWKMLTFNTGGK